MGLLHEGQRAGLHLRGVALQVRQEIPVSVGGHRHRRVPSMPSAFFRLKPSARSHEAKKWRRVVEGGPSTAVLANSLPRLSIAKLRSTTMHANVLVWCG